MYEEYLKHVCMDVTEDIKQFVKTGVFGDSEYLFVNKIDDENHGYCSYCKHEYDVAYATHNEIGICPICGSRVQTKSSRYGRKNCKNEACFYFFEKSIADSNTVICKGYYVSKDYAKDYKNPKVEYVLSAIYVFENKNATMFKKSWYQNDWEMKNSIFDFNQGWLAPKMCYCSFESIEKAIQGTSFQYTPYKTFQGHYSMVKIFNEYSKHPGIEYLVKEGFQGFIEDKLSGRSTYSAINWKADSIFKILKLSKNDLKELREYKDKDDPLFLRLFQISKKDKSSLTLDEIYEIRQYGGTYIKDLLSILKYVSLRKINNYVKLQLKKEKDFIFKNTILTTWKDYLADCKTLEMNLKDEHVLFPKSLYTAHQNTIKQIIIQADESLSIKMKARLKSLEKYSFEYNGLMIRAAKSSYELIAEGKALNHCVGTYAKRHASGETTIFLIRKVSEPDTPYYTVEIRKDIIIQVHGKNNRSPSEDVKEFIEVFKAEKLTKKKVKIQDKISIPA